MKIGRKKLKDGSKQHGPVRLRPGVQMEAAIVLEVSGVHCKHHEYERRLPTAIRYQACIASQIDDRPYVPIYEPCHPPRVIVFDSRISNFL
jgi:hypothetical protein